jgi:hypothetical protein
MQCLPKLPKISLPKISLPKMRLPKIRTGPPVIKRSQVVPSESVPKQTTQIEDLKEAMMQRNEASRQRNKAMRQRNLLWDKCEEMTAEIRELRQENWELKAVGTTPGTHTEASDDESLSYSKTTSEVTPTEESDDESLS